MTNEQQRIAHLEKLADDAGETLAFLQSRVDTLTEERDKLIQKNTALVAENAGLRNSSLFVMQDGQPPYEFYRNEWFIARLKNGSFAVLKALPEEWSYDYKTVDETHYTKDWVVGWMQTPDTEYRPNVKTPATDAAIAAIRADGVEMFAKYIALYNSNSEKHAITFAAQLRQEGANHE